MKRSCILTVTFAVVTILSGVGLFDHFQCNIYYAKSILYSWAGDTKFCNKDKNTIIDNGYKILETQLFPGDIILTKKIGYVSNLFIPGFWKHAGIYLGNAKLRNLYFDSHFDNTIPPNIDLIEALSEGVVFSTLNKCFRADNIAVLRPKISMLEIEKVIEKALSQIDKNYDFNFDLNSDSLIYCTELIYQTYLPFIELPTKKIFGRTTITANDLYTYAKAVKNDENKFDIIFCNN